MNETQLHDILVHNITQLMNSEQNHAPSMRYLSTCIDANESYIQKILNSGAFPSLEKLLAIANHYEIEPWQMLYQNTSSNDSILSIIQLLNSCPEDMLPTIQEFITYLIKIGK